MYEDVTDIMSLAIISKMESHQSGTIIGYKDILSPQKVPMVDRKNHILSNNQKRWNLNYLSRNILDQLQYTYNRRETAFDFCSIAAAIFSSRGYQHKFNSLIDTSTWCSPELFDALYARIDILQQSDKFDYY